MIAICFYFEAVSCLSVPYTTSTSIRVGTAFTSYINQIDTVTDAMKNITVVNTIKSV